MFVTLLEDKKSFYTNFEHLGFDVEELEETGRFNFVNLLTTKEAGDRRGPEIYRQRDCQTQGYAPRD